MNAITQALLWLAGTTPCPRWLVCLGALALCSWAAGLAAMVYAYLTAMPYGQKEDL